MSTLLEIEEAAARLPVEEQRLLATHLAARLSQAAEPPSGGHSVLDIPTVSVGRILKPLSPDDDLLDEMLHGDE